MPRTSRSSIQLSAEEKKQRRREQKKMSLRRARARMSEEQIEERRKKDRERYQKKKEQGLIKTIKHYTAREQRLLRKLWREKAKTKREKNKMKQNAQALLQNNTPPSSISYSRVMVGKAAVARNRRKIKAENISLKNKLSKLETKLAKYRMRLVRLKKKLPKIEDITPIYKNSSRNKSLEIKKAVLDFLTNDKHSRLTSGKKETITKKKVKKQIRFLSDSLLNLHKKFVKETHNSISYETFRRHRPFWVLTPKVSSRNMCLCITHTNNNYIVKALYNAKITLHKSATDAAKTLCCNGALNVACLERKCNDCINKRIVYNDYHSNDTALYERWVLKTVTVIIKGNPRVCKKTIKETVHTSKKQLVSLFEANLPAFMQHLANNIHQLKTIQTIKKQLSPSEGLLHIDFSENYNCKYGEEIQSAHFGGSKPQVSLHTCVYYSTELEPPNNTTKATSICTISENLRHDPVLICTHLQPVFRKIYDLSPNIKHLHVLSDGPSTQYRNKTMFHLIAKYLSKELELDTLTWHYSEKGHGKGAPDGVGGCIKRTCDIVVARGNDVSNFHSLITCAKINCKGIEIYKIDESMTADIQKIVDEATIRPFKGTLQIHQLTWSSRQENVLHARRLSCLICAAHVNCRHFEIGQIDIECLIPGTQTHSDIDTSNHSPTCSSGSEPSPNNVLLGSPIRKLATPDLPTVPNSPTTPETSSVDMDSYIRRPLKRRKMILSDDSDDSLHCKLIKKRRFFPHDSESDDDFNIF